MSSISFDNVYLLLIAVPIVLLVAIPFAVSVRKENVNGHNIASLTLHLLMAVIIAFSAAGASVLTVMTETDVYVVADVSYSADKNLDVIDGYIKNLSKNLPKNSKMGVVCFGKDYKLVTELGKKFTTVKKADVDRTETNIVSALEYTGQQFTQGVIKRIVLITDGRQSDNRAGNALMRTVDNLAEKGITVDAIYVDSNASSAVKEIQVSGVEFTSKAYLNHEESATALIESSYDTSELVTVKLYKNGVEEASKTLALLNGPNTVNFGLDTSEEGEFDYKITVEALGDTSKHNNEYGFTQTVTSVVNVLVISEKREDIEAINKLYAASANLQTYCITENPNVPVSVEQLCAFDEIMISNADITKITSYPAFVSSLDTVVSAFGKSLVTFGDLGIQNLREDKYENDALSKLSGILPVKFGSSNQNEKLYAIVIDASRSMQMLDKFTRAKKAAAHLVNYLGDSDSVCIVAFNGDISYLMKPTKASNREKILNDIENLKLGNGTLIGFGVNEAYEQFKNYSIYGEKQVMLISDGLDYVAGSDQADYFDAEKIISQMYADGIITSTMDVGRGKTALEDPDYDKKLEGAEKIKRLAFLGGGTPYEVDTDEKLKDVVFGDLGSQMTETKIDYPSRVIVNRRYDDTVKGVDFDNPDLYVNGFLTSIAETRATTVLNVSYKKSIGSSTLITVPLYAYWRYGSAGGKVACYTSSLVGEWASSFENQKQYSEFFANVFSENVPEKKNDAPFAYSVNADGKFTRVEVEPATPNASAMATVEITGPDGLFISTDMFKASTTYYYDFETAAAGKYKIKITYSYGGNVYEAEEIYTVSYADEYNTFLTFDVAELRKAIGGNGTVSTDGKLKIEIPEEELATYKASLVPALLITCAVLYVADIVVRKLKWEDIAGLFRKIK